MITKDEDYERIINKLKKSHKHYFKLIELSPRISDKVTFRVVVELLEKILESENVEFTRDYDNG